MKFPGTLTIPDEVFEKALVSMGQSLKLHGFLNIVFVGDHGGYQKSVQRAVGQLNKAWFGSGVHAIVPDAYYETSSAGFNALLRKVGHADKKIGTHAALADTALQLAVAPETVRLQRLHAAPQGGPCARRLRRRPPTCDGGDGPARSRGNRYQHSRCDTP